MDQYFVTLDTRQAWINSLSLWIPGRHGSLDFIFEHHADRNLQFETTEHQEEMDQQFIIRTLVKHGSTGFILENLAVKDQHSTVCIFEPDRQGSIVVSLDTRRGSIVCLFGNQEDRDQ